MRLGKLISCVSSFDLFRYSNNWLVGWSVADDKVGGPLADRVVRLRHPPALTLLSRSLIDPTHTIFVESLFRSREVFASPMGR